MNYDDIKRLIEDMGNSKLTEINIDFPDGTKIGMKKEIGNIVENKKVVTQEVEPQITSQENKTQKNEGNIVKSPMVGTFYLKPSPTENAYVEIGKNVKKGDTLCIIEAMKLMNEIESEFDGEIKEILIKDGETVEYGTELFIIE